MQRLFEKKNIYLICVNSELSLTLVFETYYRYCYSNKSNYSMSSNKKLKYTNIDINSVIFTKCANITLRLQTLKNNYVKVNTRVHIVF